MPAWPRILRALFVAYVVATAVHVGWILAHEPFAFDAWNVAKDTSGKPFTVGRFFDYWGFEYTHSNPRIGQPLTYLAYKLDYFAVIATPLAFLGLALAVFVLGTARWPSWRRGRDLALGAIAIGFLWFVLPQIGKTMFCRAYGANYLYGAVIQLWFLVPLRLRTSGNASPVACGAYAFPGVIAGMCNEHTGPTLCAAMLAYAWWTQRRTGAVPRLAWAGAAGMIVGFAALFFSPGQGQRYDNLAQRVSLFGRLMSRGFAGNLDIYRDFVLAAAPLLALLVIAVALGTTDDETRDRRRVALRLIMLAMIVGSAITMTIFVSPKLGPRFYLLSMALLLAGFIAFADAALPARRFAPFVVLAVIASIYAAARTVPLYGRLARESRDRLAVLEASKPGAMVTIDSFSQVDDDWWFLGDDFRAQNKREYVADYFDLAGIVFRAYDSTAALGITDVRLVGKTQAAACVEHFELGAYRGLDITTIHKALRFAASRLQPALDRVDLAVEFVGDRPPMPRPHVLVARWTPSALEGWVVKIERPGHGTQREVTVPKDMPRDLEMFIARVGDPPRRLGTASEPLHYTPWRSGMYWVLACRPAECFVVAAAKQGG